MAAPEIPLDICRQVQQLKDGGLTWAELAERMRRERPEAFGHLDLSQTRTRCRNALDKARLIGGEAGPGPAPERPAAGACAESLPKVPQADRLMEALQKGGTVEELAGRLSPMALEAALRWVGSVAGVGELLRIVEQSTARISELVAAVKAYTYMDRGSRQEVDVHAGLESTLLILGHKLQDIKVERDYEDDLPAIEARMQASVAADHGFVRREWEPDEGRASAQLYLEHGGTARRPS